MAAAYPAGLLLAASCRNEETLLTYSALTRREFPNVGVLIRQVLASQPRGNWPASIWWLQRVAACSPRSPRECRCTSASEHPLNTRRPPSTPALANIVLQGLAEFTDNVLTTGKVWNMIVGIRYREDRANSGDASVKVSGGSRTTVPTEGTDSLVQTLPARGAPGREVWASIDSYTVQGTCSLPVGAGSGGYCDHFISPTRE